MKAILDYLKSKGYSGETTAMICARIDERNLSKRPSKIAEYVDELIDDMKWDGKIPY